MSTEVPSPSNAAFDHSDPLTGFGTRRKLLSALDDIFALNGEPQLLAVFHIDGFNAYREDFGRIEGEALLVQISTHLSGALGERAACYRPRHDEFAALIANTGVDVDALLHEAVATVNARLSQFEVTLTSGIATVPLEETDAVSALALADARLYLQAPGRRARERHAGPR